MLVVTGVSLSIRFFGCFESLVFFRYFNLLQEEIKIQFKLQIRRGSKESLYTKYIRHYKTRKLERSVVRSYTVHSFE